MKKTSSTVIIPSNLLVLILVNGLLFAYATNLITSIITGYQNIHLNIKIHSVFEIIDKLVTQVIYLPSHDFSSTIITNALYLLSLLILGYFYLKRSNQIAGLLFILSSSLFIALIHVFGNLYSYHLTPFISLFIISSVYCLYLLRHQNFLSFIGISFIVCVILFTSVVATNKYLINQVKTNISLHKEAAQIILNDVHGNNNFGLYVQTSNSGNFAYNTPTIWYQIEELSTVPYVKLAQYGEYNLFEVLNLPKTTRYLVCLNYDAYGNSIYANCLPNFYRWVEYNNHRFKIFNQIKELRNTSQFAVYRLEWIN